MSNEDARIAISTATKSTDRWRAIAALIVGVIIAASLATVAWQMSLPRLPVGPVGSLQAVMLTNGQIYYGTLSRTDAASIALSDVFYVQSLVDTRTNQPINKLVSRRTEDWHAPSSMLIPIDKVMFAEVVGPQSRVALLVAEAKKKP